MKKIIIKIMFVVFMYLIFTYSSTVFGYLCELDFVSEKKEIKPEESITMTISVKNIEAENGVASLHSKLNFDVEYFDYEIIVDKDSEWIRDEQYSELDQKELDLLFQTKDNTGTKKSQNIAKVVLTAKKEVKEGKTNISLTDILLSTGDTIPQTIEISDKIIELTVVTKDNENNQEQKENIDNKDNIEESQIVDTKKDEENKTVIDQKKIETQIENKNNNLTDATESTTRMLPYAGYREIVITVVFIILIGTSIFLYKKTKKWKGI